MTVPDPNEAVRRVSRAEESERIVSILREQNVTVMKGKELCDRA